MTPAEMQDRIAELEHELHCEKDRTNRAYEQRGNLAVAFAKLASVQGWPMGRGIDSRTDKDMEWRHVVYIDLPGGEQVSYHFAPGDLHLLDGLPTYRGEWDSKWTGTTEWHELIQLKVARPSVADVERFGYEMMPEVAWRRWKIEKAKLEADPDVSETDRERILSGYAAAWSR